MSQPQILSLRANDTHSLVSVLMPAKMAVARVTQPVARHHIFAIDCSGSMTWNLQQIRQQMKNKLPQYVREGDIVTVIWFSGKGECGVIVEGLEIKSVVGLSRLQEAIDRYLKAIGLTGFLAPLEMVQKVIDRVAATLGVNVHSLLFLTDGHDNQHSIADLVKAVKPLGKSLGSATFVEYGYYCNRQLLTKLAEECGGRLIFAKDFDQYEPEFEAIVSARPSGKPKKAIRLPSLPKYGFAFSYNEEGIISYAMEDDGTVLVDDSVYRVFYHSETPEGTQVTDLAEFGIESAYASVLTLSQRMKSNDVYATLGKLGDVAVIDSYVNAFGKQKLYDFQDIVQETVLGQRKPFVAGRQNGYLPKEDAFSLIDLFNLLSENERNRFYEDHESFNYKRIGAAKERAASKVDVAAQGELAELTKQHAELQAEKGNHTKELQALSAKIAEVAAKASQASPEAEFVKNPNPYGTPITDLVWNSDRPNLSIRVKQTGMVKVPDNPYGITEVESFQYRTYTIIKDGIVNVEKLPVLLTAEAYLKLLVEGVIPDEGDYDAEKVYVLDLTKLPVINRKMVKEVSAEELFRLQLELLKTKGAQSVFNYFQKDKFPKVSKEFVAKYSTEAAAFLKELGVTDYNGFAPRTTDKKVGENYMSVELAVKIAGIGSTVKVIDVYNKLLAEKPTTLRESVYVPALEEYHNFISSAIYKDSANPLNLLETWLLDKQSATVAKARKLMGELARIKFSVILGQVWFKEFATQDDKTMTLEIENQSYDFSVEKKDVQIDI